MTADHEARIAALEARQTVTEAALAGLIDMLRAEAVDDDDAPAEDMEGNPLPRPRVGETTL